MKSTHAKESSRKDRYTVKAVRNQGEPYSSEHCDVVACWVEPEDEWYLIPVQDLDGVNVTLYPHRQAVGGKYEKFRGNWVLLLGAPSLQVT